MSASIDAARRKRTAIAIACVALAVVALVAWLATSLDERAPSSIVSGIDNSSVKSTATPLDAASGELAREPDESRGTGARTGAATIDCAVRLLRWPDRKPLAGQSAIVHGSDDASDEAQTDASGVLVLRGVRAGDRRRFELERYEPVDFVVPEPSAERIDVECLPTFGLWGRVRKADGAPIADAEVEIASISHLVGADRPELETPVSAHSVEAARERGNFAGFAEVYLSLRSTRLDHTRTSTDGWYYLAVDHERAGFAKLAVEKAGAARGELSVELPRDGHELPDVVLREGEAALRVRVVQVSGEAVASASVYAVFFTGEPGAPGTSYDEGPSASTDEQGVAVLPRFDRSALLHVRKQGLASIGTREQPAASGKSIRIEPHVADVEVVMEELPGYSVRLVDRATGKSVPNGNVIVDLAVPSNDEAAPNSFDVHFDHDHRATAWIPRAYGARVRVYARAHNYRAVDELHDVPTVGGELQDLVLVLDRDGNVPVVQPIRGIVMRNGAFVPKAKVTAERRIQPPSGPEYSTVWSGTTDDEGRFRLDTSSLRGAERVLFQARTAKLAEFGMTGPMSVADMQRSDVRIEIAPTVAVPISVAGAQPGQAISASISLWEDDMRIHVAANSVAFDASGSVVHVNVPAGRRATITTYCDLGAEGGNPCSEELELDPARADIEHRLTIDLPKVVLWTVSGRAASFETDSAPELYVAIGGRGADAHAAVRVSSDGTFRFSDVLPGEYQMRLLRANSSTWANVLARRTLVVDGDVTGLVLVPDLARLRAR
ncbi:MAG: hypothetical protein ACKVWV_12905 [Planctomycetota bacterium]